MFSVSTVVTKGIYGFKMELGSTEDKFRERRRHSNTAAKLVPTDCQRQRADMGGKIIYSCLVPSSKIPAHSFHDRLVIN